MSPLALPRLPRLPGVPSLDALPGRQQLADLASTVSRLRPPRVPLPSGVGRRHRRTAAHAGVAHLEVRGAHHEHVAGAVERSLSSLEGVSWAAVDRTTGRAVVAFDEDRVELSHLVTAVHGVERSAEVESLRFAHDLAEHPLDGSSAQAAAIALVADGVGFGLSITGVVLRLWRIPIEIGGAVATVGEQPRVRQFLTDRIGHTATEVSLSTVNVVGLTLGHGPVGIGLDALQRLNVLTAARATSAAWQRRQAALLDGPDAVARASAETGARPAPQPAHPVESYADRATLASVLTGAAALVSTGSPRRVGAMLLAAAPKPARLGRELWAGQLERILARRSTIVLDRDALRRLDQIDLVVLDAEAVVEPRWRPDRVVVAPGTAPSKVQRRLRDLFDPDDPTAVREDGRWAVGPVERLQVPRDESLGDWDAPARDDEGLLGVRRDDRLVALFVAAPQLRAGAHALADTLREAEVPVVLAGGDDDLAGRLHVHAAIDEDLPLVDLVHSYQRDGSVVAVVSDHHAALGCADVGIGVLGDDAGARRRSADRGRFPSAAAIVAPDLDAARFVLEAAVIAREVTRQGNAISLGGASLGSILALTAPAHRAGARAANAVNAASVVAMANGLRAAVQLDRHPDPVGQDEEPRWHELPRSQVLQLLETSKAGLSSEAAALRRPHRTRPLPAPLRFAQAVAAEVANPLTPVLAGSALLAASVGSSVDAVIVLSVVGLNGLISGSQRYVAESSIDALAKAGSVRAHVRRDGRMVVVDASQLVRGDVVVLEAGDTVPADCRVLRAQALEVDESSLTGESEPIRKRTAATFASLLAERDSMVYAGTAVVSGRGEAVVVAVGRETAAAAPGNGRRSGVAGGVGGVEARLRQLSRISLPVAAGAGAAVTAGQVLRGTPLRRALPGGVSLAVAAVPEGLPMLATVGQLAAAQRLTRHQVLVRNPRAVEALGRTEVLCVDKTGTLTQGRIELRAVSDGVHVHDLVGGSGGELSPAHRLVLSAARRATPETNGERKLPHFTDRAVAAGADRAGVDAEDGAPGWTRHVELPFGNDRSFHATWGEAGDEVVLSAKGAPEAVLERCTVVRAGDEAVPLDDRRAELERHVTSLARRGLRVLAVAERRQPGDAPEPVEEVGDDDVADLELLGFLALADPVRETSAEAIRGLREAGVELVMVTGDHPSTAEGIAAELGILNGNRVVTGAELDRMSDEVLDAAIEHISVFARVTPAHKVRVVASFQRAGRAVAMTGDGANDANAMRLADAGIAIGTRAAPSARDAADVIIADDRIETVVQGIIEGRALWSSVRESLALLLGGNLGEIGFMLTASAIAGEPALSTRQVLLVNLLTDVAPALAIVARPPATRSPSELAAEGPDRSLGNQLTESIAIRATATAVGATAAWLVGRATGRPRRASTMGLVAVVGTQLAQTLLVRRHDPVVIASALGSAGVMLALVETPVVSRFFGCTPLGPVALFTVGVSSVGSAVAAAVAPGVLEKAAGRFAR